MERNSTTPWDKIIKDTWSRRRDSWRRTRLRVGRVRPVSPFVCFKANGIRKPQWRARNSVDLAALNAEIGLLVFTWGPLTGWNHSPPLDERRRLFQDEVCSMEIRTARSCDETKRERQRKQGVMVIWLIRPNWIRICPLSGVLEVNVKGLECRAQWRRSSLSLLFARKMTT